MSILLGFGIWLLGGLCGFFLACLIVVNRDRRLLYELERVEEERDDAYDRRDEAEVERDQAHQMGYHAALVNGGMEYPPHW